MHDSAPSASSEHTTTEAPPSGAGSLKSEHPVSQMLEAVIFEQWLRFSWIAEDADGDFCIQIPENAAQEISTDYPQFRHLLERLNGTIVDANMACSAILAFARDELGEDALAVLEDTAFQENVSRFHLWLHEQADMLEAHPYNFDQWKTLFMEAVAKGSAAGEPDAVSGSSCPD